MSALFLKVFLLIFVAELADKSRIAGFFLSTTFRAPWRVFWGMTFGYLLLDGIAVYVGGMIPAFYQGIWLDRVVATVFVIFGVISLLIPVKAGERVQGWLIKVQHWGAFTVSFIAIAVSEIGDRTQLGAAAWSAESGKPWVVLAGSMSALMLLNLITVWLGEEMSRYVNFKILKVVGGVLFIAMGLLILFQKVS
jgi:putative Ca2+/H+ antiporter (TMEM165/GDT1 family)